MRSSTRRLMNASGEGSNIQKHDNGTGVHGSNDKMNTNEVGPLDGHMGRFDLRAGIQKNERCIEIDDIKLNTKLMGRSVGI
ncbi:hypothetical protein Tco_1479695 [Tanacetum coccineum]